MTNHLPAANHSPTHWFQAPLAALLTLALSIMGGQGQAMAQITPASAGTGVHKADNGVSVVNIAKPNAQGLSVNQYTDYNVAASGLILNNAATGSGNAQGQVTTQLGGLIDTNANLTTSAKAILNEVTSTNPSVLSGYTEVAGTRADVIVANPNGITCSGCGFINTAALTLATGKSNIDANGNLIGFNVTGGILTLNGTGLDAQSTDYAALLGRKVALSGPAFGKVLDVVAGANAWDYNAHTATPIAGTGAAPDYAIDSTTVGGMYANRIRLIATEAGVGVRMLGDAAASSDNLSLSSAGDITLGGAVSAKGALTISSTANDAGAISATSANLSSGGDFGLSATGGITLTGGSAVAGGNLTLVAGSLSDTASNSTAANANQRFAGGALSLTVGGAAGLNGVSYGAAGTVNGQTGSLATTGFGYLYSNGGALSLSTTQGDLALGAYAMSSATGLTLAASHGGISTLAGTGEGVVSAAGPVSLTAANGLSNAGVISANNGAVNLALGGSSTNSGGVVASGAVFLTDAAGAGSESFTNTASGQLLAGASLSANVASLVNNGTVQAATGTSVTGTSVTNTGLFIASTATNANGVLTVESLTNSGTLQSARDLALHISGALTNSNTIVAGRGLTVDGGATITNTTTGVLSAASINAAGASLANDGQLVASGDIGLTVTGDLKNTGTVGANGTLSVAAATVENLAPTSGTANLQSQAGGSITATQGLTNSGGLYLANATGAGVITAASITNQAGGVIASQGGLNVTLTGMSLDNAGSIAAAHSLTVTGTGPAFALSNDAGGYLQAGSATGDTLKITGTGVAVTTAATSVVAANTLDLTLDSLNNAGTLNAAAGLSYSVTGAVANSGVMIAGSLLQGQSASLVNAASGGIQGGGVDLATTDVLENDGAIATPSGSGADIVLTAGTLTNAAGAYLQSNRALSVTLSGVSLTNAGTMVSGGDMDLHGGASALTVTNTGTGVIAAQDTATGGAPATLTIDGASASLTNQSGGQIVGDRLALTLQSLINDGSLGANVGSNTLTVAGALTNTGTLILSADSAGTGTIYAGSVTNSGNLVSNDNLVLNLTSGLTNGGTIQAVGDLTVAFGANAGSIQNNGTVTLTLLPDGFNQAAGSGAQLLAGGALSISGANTDFVAQTGLVSGGTVTLDLASLNNKGSLVSSGDLGITASGGVTNTGTLGANGGLTLSAASLLNIVQSSAEGMIQSQTGGTITVTGALTNNGDIYLANQSGDGVINAGTLSQDGLGSLFSQGKLTFNMSGASLDNSGLIYSANDLAINALGAGGVLALTNEFSGTIETAAPTVGAATGKILISGAGVTLANLSGVDGPTGATLHGTIIGNDLSFATLAGFTNQGVIQSRGDFTLASVNALQNSGTLYAAGGAFSITAGGFQNLAGATLQGDTGGTLSLGSGDFSNAGTVIGSTDGLGALTINALNVSNLSPTGKTAVIQSSAGLTFNFPSFVSSTLTNSGDIVAAAALAIRTPDIVNGALVVTNENGGIVAAQAPTGAATPASLQIIASSLDNQSGAAIVGDALTLHLNGGGVDLDNASQIIVGAGEADLTLAGEMVNGGVFYTGGVTNITAPIVENLKGGTFEPHSATLTLGSSFTNSGFVYTPGYLSIFNTGGSAPLDISNSAPSGGAATDGLFQVGGMLTIEAGGASVTNNTGATMVTAAALISGDSFTNHGTFQSGSNTFIETLNSLTNDGAIYFQNTIAGTTPQIEAKDLTNSGTIDAYANLFLTSFNSIGNSGTIASGGVLEINANGLPVTNSGLLSATNEIDVTGGNLTFMPTGRATADQYVQFAGTLDLQDNGTVGASIFAGNNFYITVSSLGLDGARSRIIGSSNVPGASTLSVSNGLTNNGLIFSADTLTVNVSGGDLNNAVTGGISAGNALTVNNFSGAIYNAGELYAGSSLTLNATTIQNQASTTGAAANTVDEGSIESGGSISATANTFQNYSNVSAGGDVTVNAHTFVNAVVGDWSTTGLSTATSTSRASPYDTLTGVQSGCGASGHNPYYCTSYYDFWYDYGITTRQAFNNLLSGPNYTPQIVSGGTLLVENFNSGSNIGALMSAQTINLQGATNSSFTSNSLALETTSLTYYYYTQGSTLYHYTYAGNNQYIGTPQSTNYNPNGTGACTGGGGPAPSTCGGGPGGNDEVVYNSDTWAATNPGGTRVGLFGTNVSITGAALTLVGGTTNTQLKTGSNLAPLTTTGPTLGPVSTPSPIAGSVATIFGILAGAPTPTGAHYVDGTTLTSSTAAASLSTTAVSTQSGVGTTTTTRSISGASGTTITPAAVGSTVNGKPTVTLQGTTITLPTNPNGQFVVTPGSGSKYLVETNPLYVTPISNLSSDLLATKLGLDPSTLQQRLGDANYEAYLISQQLLGETGKQLLAGYADLSSELNGLYTNAASDASVQGLVYGQALTSSQVAGLPGDIIWMVSTVVDGHTVLAPVVYLSPATKASLVQGSGIIADNVYLNVASLKNDGGVINGSQTNVILASGDVNNTANGVIAGGQVYLQSTNGAVNNIRSTIAGVQSATVIANGNINNIGGAISADNLGLKSVTGGMDLSSGKIAAGNSLSVDVAKNIDINGSNNITGKNISLTSRAGDINVITQGVGAPVAAITASGSLSLNAADNINVKGGVVSAGKDLSLVAGHDIDISTITQTTSSRSKIKGGTETGTATTNIGSAVTAGGNLYVKAGNDVDVTGSKVAAGGDAAIIAGNQVNIAAATDTSHTVDSTKHNGVFQSSSKVVTTDTATDAASSVSIGGSAYIKSGGDTNIAGGSSLNVGGNLVTDTSGHNLNITAGTNTTTTNTVSKVSGLGVANALYGKQTTTTKDAEGKNDSSSVKVGGQIASLDNKTINITGSNLSAAKGGILQATDGVNVLAGHDTSQITTHQETTTILGGVSSSKGGSSASASAGASASKEKLSAGVQANAQAEAHGSNSSGLNIYNKTVTDSTTNASNSVASNVVLGGNSLIDGGKSVTIQGSNVSTTGGAHLTLQGKDVNILAAQNTYTNTTTSKSSGFGIYTDSQGSASASASASAGAGIKNLSAAGILKGGPSASANAGANANAEASGSVMVTVGARQINSKDTEDKLTNVGSNVSAGGTLTINADNLTTQGSKLSAGGDLIENAANISNLAVQDHDVSTHSSTTNTEGLFVKVGGDASASANVSASASMSAKDLVKGGKPQVKTDASASADVGVNAAAGFRAGSVSEGSTDASTTAVTTSLTAGGNIIRNAKTITDQGTKLNAGGNIVQNTATITDIAVSNTKSHTESSSNNEFELAAVASASGGVSTKSSDSDKSLGIKAGDTYTSDTSSKSSSEQQVTEYNAGGQVVSVSSGKTTLLGAKINGEQGVTLQAGSLDYQTATNTKSETKGSHDVDASVTLDVLNKSVNVAVGYDQGNESTTKTQGVGGSVTSGSGKVNIVTTGGDANLVGTKIDGQTGANVVALNGNVNLSAAQTVTTTKGQDVGVDVSATVGKKAKAADVSVDYKNDSSTKVENDGAEITSGSGAVNVVGQNVTLAGAKIAAADTVNLTATNGVVTQSEVKDTTTDKSLSLGLSASVEDKKVKPKMPKVGYSNGTDDDKTTGTDITAGNGITIGSGPSPIATPLIGAPTAPTVSILPTAVAPTAVTTSNPAGAAVFNQPNAAVQTAAQGAPVLQQAVPVVGPQTVAGGVKAAPAPTAPTLAVTKAAPVTGIVTGPVLAAPSALSGAKVVAAQGVAVSAPVQANLVGAGPVQVSTPGPVSLAQARTAPGVTAPTYTATPPASVPANSVTPAPDTNGFKVAQNTTTPPVEPVTPPVTPALPVTPPLVPTPPITPTQPTAPPVTPTPPVTPVTPPLVPTPPVTPTELTAPPVTPTLPAVPTQPTAPPVTPTPPVTPVTPPLVPTPPVTPTQPTTLPVAPTLPVTPPLVPIPPSTPVELTAPPVTPTLPAVPTQPSTPPVAPIPLSTPPLVPTSPTTPAQLPPPPVTPTSPVTPPLVPTPPVTPTQPVEPPATPTLPTTPVQPGTPEVTPDQPAPLTGPTKPVLTPKPKPDPIVVPVDVVRPTLPGPVAPGKPVTAALQGNQLLPCWLTIDPLTGAITGRPSDADAAANIPIIVVEQVPQADGATRSLSIIVHPGQFGERGSQCNSVRTNPAAGGRGSGAAGSSAQPSH